MSKPTKPLAELVKEAHDLCDETVALTYEHADNECSDEDQKAADRRAHVAITALAAYAEAAEKRAEEVEREVERLQRTFKHVHSHIGKEAGDDSCAECGLDLRDAVHERAALREEG